MREDADAQSLRSIAGGRLGPIEWAISKRPYLGETVSGDHGVVLDAGGDAALFGVVDGLGHGNAASVAAGRAAAVLADNPAEPVDVLTVLCHRALAETRGAAMSLASLRFDSGTLSWIGVGNVCASVIEASPTGPVIRATALLSAGVVGYLLPPQLQAHSVKMKPGDLLLMTSDGIIGDFVSTIDLSKSAEIIADEMLRRWAKETDDALVLAARHRGHST